MPHAPSAAAVVLSPDELLAHLRRRYPGLVLTTTWNARALRYNPGASHAYGVEFVTIEERDGGDAGAHGLDAIAAYRLSFGLAPERYTALFGAPPQWRDGGADAAEAGAPPRVDVVEPHPRYGWMSWAAVVNPSPATMERLWPLLDEGYALARARHATRNATPS
jgi:hypothetical protein